MGIAARPLEGNHWETWQGDEIPCSNMFPNVPITVEIVNFYYQVRPPAGIQYHNVINRMRSNVLRVFLDLDLSCRPVGSAFGSWFVLRGSVPPKWFYWGGSSRNHQRISSPMCIHTSSYIIYTWADRFKTEPWFLVGVDDQVKESWKACCNLALLSFCHLVEEPRNCAKHLVVSGSHCSQILRFDCNQLQATSMALVNPSGWYPQNSYRGYRSYPQTATIQLTYTHENIGGRRSVFKRENERSTTARQKKRLRSKSW